MPEVPTVHAEILIIQIGLAFFGTKSKNARRTAGFSAKICNIKGYMALTS